MKLKIPPALLLVMGIGLMWLLDYMLPVGDFQFTGMRYVSVGIFGVGILLGVLGIWEFYRASTTVDPHNVHKARTMVDSGLYRLSRNPMYVGLACVLISAVFYL